VIIQASEFTFKAPPEISRARRVLIKPSAAYPWTYPVTTSRDILSVIIGGIREVSDADILILDGTPNGDSIRPIYQSLGYDFPRVLMLDVKDCVCVEVDNPLTKPLAVPTFWIPNVILSSDYLISVAPLKVINGRGSLSIMNLLSLLPFNKYGGDVPGGWKELYFTLPFDLGIVEARQKFIVSDDPTRGEAEECGRVFIGEPYAVDCEASETSGLKTRYLDLIRTAKIEFD
jgi:hypothetical protein